MRYSNEKAFDVIPVEPRQRRHTALFNAVRRQSSAEDRAAGILFVGGASPFDIDVRQAQAHLRLDRLPSYWSHTALILDWPDGAEPEDVILAEVTLAGGHPDCVPERNGVTLDKLEKYMDRRRYPNLAFATLRASADAAKGQGLSSDLNDPIVSADTKKELREAALEPSRERARYPLWEWTGVWARFLATGIDNPLQQEVALPGAAYCEYVYEAAGFDLTPGATGPNACPEVLWSTLRYWSDRFARAERGLAAWSSVEREASPTREPLSTGLKRDFNRLVRLRPKPQAKKSKPRKKRS